MTSGSARPGLAAGRQGRGIADDPALLCRALADQIANHGEPGGDAEPHTQMLSPRQSANRLDYRQPRPHRSLGIVLMRLRVAEIDQHPVAHIFGDKPIEAADGLGDGAMIIADQPTQILRVMTGRERGRADQIAEHDRECRRSASAEARASGGAAVTVAAGSENQAQQWHRAASGGGHQDDAEIL